MWVSLSRLLLSMIQQPVRTRVLLKGKYDG